MKQFILVILVMSTFTVVGQHPVLKIGEKMPKCDESMQCATTGQTFVINDLKEENGLLLIFSCNTCPFVLAWEDRYPVVAELAKKNHIGFALVNSNYMKRDGDESMEAMKEHAKAKNYKWPYLDDDESELANLLGAQTTPHVFLFDKNMKLVYKGAIDDNYKDADEVEDFYLKDALNSLGSGKEIKTKETRNLGCSIKRKAT